MYDSWKMNVSPMSNLFKDSFNMWWSLHLRGWRGEEGVREPVRLGCNRLNIVSRYKKKILIFWAKINLGQKPALETPGLILLLGIFIFLTNGFDEHDGATLRFFKIMWENKKLCIFIFQIFKYSSQ